MSVYIEVARDWLLERFNWFRNYLNNRRSTDGAKRVLVHEILSIQVLSAALFGGLAIASLYWGGQWVLQDNYGRWALQWTEELNELGSPLYLSDDGEARIRLESFVERYPEIDRVSYFAKDGEALFSVNNSEEIEQVEDLTVEKLNDAVAVIGQNKPYVMNTGLLSPRQFEILAPVWTESLVDDGLFDFNAIDLEAETQTELLGFVSINLDFVIFHDRLLANIKGAIVILLILLVVFAAYGRRALQRALTSISDLQEPIRELAKGNLGVKFEPAEHREISDIVEALENYSHGTQRARCQAARDGQSRQPDRSFQPPPVYRGTQERDHQP